MSRTSSQIEEPQGYYDQGRSEEQEEFSEANENSHLWETASDVALRADLMSTLSEPSPEDVEPEAQVEVDEANSLLRFDPVSGEVIGDSESVAKYHEWLASLVEPEEGTIGQSLSDHGEASELETEEKESEVEEPEANEEAFNYLVEEEEEEAVAAHPVNDEIQNHEEATSISAQSSEVVGSQPESAPLPSNSENVLQGDWSEYADLLSPEILEYLNNAGACSSSSDYAEDPAKFFGDEDQVGAEAVQEAWLYVEVSNSPQVDQSRRVNVQSVSPDHSHVSEPCHNESDPPSEFTGNLREDLPEYEEVGFQQEPGHQSQTGEENSQGGKERQQYKDLTLEEIQYFFTHIHPQANQIEPQSHQQVEHSEVRNLDKHFKQRSDVEQEYGLQRHSSTSNARLDSTNIFPEEQIFSENDDETEEEDGPSVEERIIDLEAKIARSCTRTARKLARIADNKKTIREMNAALKRQRSDDLDDSKDEPAKKRKTDTYRRPSTEKKPKPKGSKAKASKAAAEEEEPHFQMDDAPAQGSRRGRTSRMITEESFAYDEEAESESGYSPDVPVSAPFFAPFSAPSVGNQLKYSSKSTGPYFQQPNLGGAANFPNGYQPSTASFSENSQAERRSRQLAFANGYIPMTPQSTASRQSFQQSMPANAHGSPTPQNTGGGRRFQHSASTNNHSPPNSQSTGNRQRSHQSTPANNHGPPTPQHMGYPSFQSSYTPNNRSQNDQRATKRRFIPAPITQSVYSADMTSQPYLMSNSLNQSSSTNGYSRPSLNAEGNMQSRYPSSMNSYVPNMSNGFNQSRTPSSSSPQSYILSRAEKEALMKPREGDDLDFSTSLGHPSFSMGQNNTINNNGNRQYGNQPLRPASDHTGSPTVRNNQQPSGASGKKRRRME